MQLLMIIGPLPSNSQHSSYDDHLEVNAEDDRSCSGL